jgi:phosphopantothenoylcysteine decarboxylase/phosphopantothenate--cysteine ligase
MKQQKILLIITGSIAAYKSMDLIRLLVKKSYDVRCILTKGAQEFITPLLASSLSNNKAYSELFSHDDEVEMGHIQLSRQADLIVVAPSTADFIAKIANGYADDLASNVILAANKKILLAPAMNEKMWDNKATQKNLVTLVENGITIIEPENDMLACGEVGTGKMSSPEKICEKIENFFANQNLLKGKKILLTGGSTIEAIDPVRFIGNHSSGKQSIEIAKILSEMGAEVTFISGNITTPIPLAREQIIRVKSADEMFAAVKENLANQDVFIACAAVADFKVKNIAQEKIKKTSEDEMSLQLTKNPDILEFVGTNKFRPKLVIGFAAESENLEKFARAKLEKKNCDLIVANDIRAGEIFGSNLTGGFFVAKKGSEAFSEITKSELARLLATKIKGQY